MIKSIKHFLLLLIAPTILELNSQALPKDFTQIDQNILNKHIIEEVNILRKRMVKLNVLLKKAKKL